ncbi:MAG: AAA family ATPase, partial [Clostridia bacterium]|nr:AAA family ATPase [Clostridia bacterium]
MKIVTGIRRCGKSFLLFNLFKRRLLDEGVPSGNIVEIALDEERFEPLRNPIRLAEHIRARLRGKKGPRFVLIDEIQLAYPVLPPGVDPARVAPEARKRLYTTFYDVLNELRALPDTDVYVTGSNSETLSSDVATNFRDRGFEIRL